MKIVIVGGGTAAWLSAFIFSHATKGNDITLIESMDVPIVGVGEGSTGIFADLLNGRFFPTDVQFEEVKRVLDATPKLAINFKNWTSKKDKNYLSPVDGTPTATQFKDTLFLQGLKKHRENYHLSSTCGFNWNENRMAGGAFHFNTNKVGELLKNKCIYKGVEVINGTVQKCILNENGEVHSLLMDDNNMLEGDLFVDATGFKKFLISELDEWKWVDYVGHLPMNAAIPFDHRYEDMSEEEFNNIRPETTAQAMNAGWQWMIPTTHRVGKGYVFDDTMISEDEAIKEINDFYGKEIEVRNKIKFRSGRLDKQWMKNVLAIGLSGAFAEPLQATSIHTTIVQLIEFTRKYLKQSKEETLTDTNRNKFNTQMSRVYDDMRDFLVLHYTGDRDDTPFWKKIKTQEHITPQVKEILEMSKHTIPDMSTFNIYFGHVNNMLWNWTLAGLGHITPELAEKEMKYYRVDNEAWIDDHINKYRLESQNSQSMQDYIMDVNPLAKEKFVKS